MKNFLTTVLLLAATVMSAQQDATLFNDVNRIGIFGGPIFEFTALNEEIISSTGGGGGVIFNDFFFSNFGSSEESSSVSSRVHHFLWDFAHFPACAV